MNFLGVDLRDRVLDRARSMPARTHNRHFAHPHEAVTMDGGLLCAASPETVRCASQVPNRNVTFANANARHPDFISALMTGAVAF